MLTAGPEQGWEGGVNHNGPSACSIDIDLREKRGIKGFTAAMPVGTSSWIYPVMYFPSRLLRLSILQPNFNATSSTH